VSAPEFGSPAIGPDAPKWRLARFLRVTVAKLFIGAYRVRVLDAEKIPTTGGFILAGNHVSYLDPVLLWCTFPREPHFVAKSELFEVGPLGWLLRRVWVFPITRASADREAITRATTLLAGGEPVCMFPEGTRKRPGTTATDDLGEAHSGVAFIAMRAGVPVLPVGIVGTEKALPAGAKIPRFPQVTIQYGDPIDPASFTEGGRKEKLAAMTAEIMKRIAAARDAAQEAS
jgi:1-acyl-sn-glycerol-3-phosphate acyltransferase